MFSSVYTKNFADISVDRDAKILIIKWNGNSTSEEYRDTMECALEIAKELNLDGWISDAKNGAAVTPEDMEWVSNTFITKAFRQIKKVAVVTAEDIFRKIETEDIEDALKKSIARVAYFDHLENAKKWIEQ